jgi:uncharacterized protein YkuJ
MKEVNKAFYDNSVKMAISFWNKEMKAIQEVNYSEAAEFFKLAQHHRKEASKYLSEIEA